MMSSKSNTTCDNSAFRETAYTSEFKYRGKQVQPKRFHDYVSFVLRTQDKLTPRCFPHFALHVSPHRLLELENSSQSFGPTGVEYGNAERGKPQLANADITDAKEDESDCQADCKEDLSADKCESRQEKKELGYFGNQKNLKVEDDSLKRSEKMAPKLCEIPQHIMDGVAANIYKSTSRRQTEGIALPVSDKPVVLPDILGKNEEHDLYHSVFKRIGTWKSNIVPENWERVQERSLYEDPRAKEYRPVRLRYRELFPGQLRNTFFCSCHYRRAHEIKKPVSCPLLSCGKPKTRLLSRRQQPSEITTTVTKMERPNSQHSFIRHIRPSPGYAGFVPKLPVIANPPMEPPLMMSSSAATYRNVSSENMRPLEFAHKSPLSKLVTTYSPCNPFNKITPQPIGYCYVDFATGSIASLCR